MGLRAADWPEEVEGTYLRMDVPHIVPHLLNWLEGQKPGTSPPLHACTLTLYSCALAYSKRADGSHMALHCSDLVTSSQPLRVP